MAVLCVDIGGSKLLAGVMAEDGRVLHRSGRPLAEATRPAVEAAILEESRRVLAEYERQPVAGAVSLAGVSIPGLASPEQGLWVYAPFSGIANFDLRSFFWRELGLMAYMENDGNTCAAGEKMFGAAKEADDFLWLTVSNGVGGGLFLNGRLYRGGGGNAGEVGHLKVAEGGRRCPCGANGCLEAYAAGPGVSKTYAEITGCGALFSAKEIAEKAHEGEAAAVQTFEQEGKWLARGIAAAVNLLNLPLVVVGGGVAGAFGLFAPALHRELEACLFTAGNPALRVVKTALGYEAALVGAGAYALAEARGAEQ